MGSKKKGAPDVRRVPIPTNRLSPLKEQWKKLYEPIVKQLKLEIRFNQKKKQVELRASKACTEISALQKGVDFVTAFTYGFDIDDALALVRLDELFLEIFKCVGEQSVPLFWVRLHRKSMEICEMPQQER